MNKPLALILFLPLLGCTGPEVGDSAAEAEESAGAAALLAKAELGKRIFFDTSLSVPAGQSCATCHDPARAFTDPRPGPTSQGAVAGRFGVRNTPSINYASFIPPFAVAGDEAGYTGAFFLDGRSPSLEAQVGGPLLNPLEMNNPTKAAVIGKIQAGGYAWLFRQVYGSTAFDNPDQAFDHLAEAVAAYERDGILRRFTSKYDAYLAGKSALSPSEARGLALFEDPAKGNCAQCHLSRPSMTGAPPVFSDFGYDNIGTPKNPLNGFYKNPVDLNPDGDKYVDSGLGVVIHNPRQFGTFKAPSLRNVAVTAPYGHNGYFADLRAVVKFYNDRDVATWDPPEVTFNVNKKTMGDLKLTNQEIDDLVAFMGTLTDGYFFRRF